MKIGILGSNSRRGATLASLVDEVVTYEKQGFRSYWAQQASTFDVLTMLAVIGHSTARIELGIATVPTYPRRPWAMMHQAGTVNAVADGRLVLGVGPTAEIAYESLGSNYDEAVRHIRDYVGDEEPAHGGETADFPEPPRPKVLVSALTPAMRKAAGLVADGAVTWMVSEQTIRNYTAPEVTKAAADAGRDAPRIAVGLPVCVHDDKEQAVARANEVYRIYGEAPTYRRQLDAQGIESPGDIALTGNEGQVKAHLEAFFDAGATEIVVSLFAAGGDSRESFARTTACLRGLLASA